MGNIFDLSSIDDIVELYEEGTIDRQIAENARIEVYTEHINDLITCYNNPQIREASGGVVNFFKMIWKGILKLIKFLVKMIVAPVLAFFGLSSWLNTPASTLQKVASTSLSSFCKINFTPTELAKHIVAEGGDNLAEYIETMVADFSDYDYKSGDSTEFIKGKFKHRIDSLVTNGGDKVVGKEMVTGVAESVERLIKNLTGFNNNKGNFSTSALTPLLKPMKLGYDEFGDQGESNIKIATALDNVLYGIDLFMVQFVEDSSVDELQSEFIPSSGGLLDDNGWVAAGVVAPLMSANPRKFSKLKNYLDGTGDGAFTEHKFNNIPIMNIKADNMSKAVKDYYALSHSMSDNRKEAVVTRLHGKPVPYDNAMIDYIKNNSAPIKSQSDIEREIMSSYVSSLDVRFDITFDDDSIKNKKIHTVDEEGIKQTFEEFESRVVEMGKRVDAIHDKEDSVSQSDAEVQTLINVFNKVILGVKEDIMTTRKNLASSIVYPFLFGTLTKLALNQTLLMSLDVVKKDLLTDPKMLPSIGNSIAKVDKTLDDYMRELV